VTTRRAVLLGLAALASVAPGAAAATPPPLTLKVAFSDGARLGTSTSMRIDLRVRSDLPPVTEFRLLTPSHIDLASSRLGASACRRPAADITRVLGPIVHDPCPANSLMGTGSATANLMIERDEGIPGAGLIELHAGAPIQDKPGLVVIVNTFNPARLQLTYAGYLYVPPPSFGVGLAIMVPPIPRPPFGAPVALSSLHLVVGAKALTYYTRVRGRRVAYHPGGIPLPARCPASRFRFRVLVRFTDGTRRTVDSTVPCPASLSRS
jgi:hypothetical protein